MKGMAFLYGDKNEKVDIELLSIEQLDNVKTKLSNAAIELNVDIKPVLTNIENDINTEIIYNIPQNDFEINYKLEDYSLKLIKKNMLYIITFKIMDYF
jgi:hypothetical protein